MPISPKSKRLLLTAGIVGLASGLLLYVAWQHVNASIYRTERAWARTVLQQVVFETDHRYRSLCDGLAGPETERGLELPLNLVAPSRLAAIQADFAGCDLTTPEIEARIAGLLSDLRVSFARLRWEGDGYLFLFNDRGRLLIHPKFPPNTDGSGLTDPETGKPLIEGWMAAARNPAAHPSGDHVVFYEPLGWYFGVSPHGEGESRLTGDIVRVVLLLVTGFGFLSVLASLLSARMASRPFRDLRKRMEAVRQSPEHPIDNGEEFPVSGTGEAAVLASLFNEMLSSLRKANALNFQLYQEMENFNKTQEYRISQRTATLSTMLNEFEGANYKLMESIRYAKMIQASMLPNPETVRLHIPKSFTVWRPRDMVGGDVFYVESVGKGFVVAVVDCTGHGVPGAFMTIIALSALRQIVKDEACYDPSEILKRLNFIVQTTLQQDTDYAATDDGLDAGICSVSGPDGSGQRVLLYAGARLPLHYVSDGKVQTIKGDRQSIGYKASRRYDVDFNFTNHLVEFRKGMCFYMATDGLTDQLDDSGEKRFGTRRLKKVIQENFHRGFEEQRARFLLALREHKGKQEVLDDITLIGFGS